MSLPDLPEELIEMIAEYLSFEDIYACSKVNDEWDIAFDIERVWARFCTMHPKYFITQVSQLKCSPEAGWSSAKRQKMNELQVLANLQGGRNHSAVVDCGKIYCDSAVDFVDEDGNHWLFVSCMERRPDQPQQHQLQVWNLNNEPTLHSWIDTPLVTRYRFLYTQLTVYMRNLLFVHEKNLLIYIFSNLTNTLEFVKEILIFSNSELTEYNNFKVTIVGDMVLAVSVDSFQNYTTKVWNRHGTKVHNESSPHLMRHVFHTSPFLNVVSNNCDKILLSASRYHYGSLVTFCFKVFDLSLLQYTNFYVKEEAAMFISQEFSGNIACVCYKVDRSFLNTSCYNIDDGTVVFQKSLLCKEDYCLLKLISSSSCTSSIEKLLVVIGNKFHLFKLRTKETLSLFTAGINSNVKVLNSKLLILSTYCKKKVIQFEMWNYETGRQLYVINLELKPEYERQIYNFIFQKQYIILPKIIAIKDSNLEYPRDRKNNNNFIVLSFW